MTNEILWDDLMKKFIEVRDTLSQNNQQYAYRMAYKQPWKFYKEHTTEEAANILLQKYPD